MNFLMKKMRIFYFQGIITDLEKKKKEKKKAISEHTMRKWSVCFSFIGSVGGKGKVKYEQ